MGTDVDFVNQCQVQCGGKEMSIGEVVRYEEELADELFARERTRTYQSLRIATLK
jgi:hypothetical protein